MYRGSYGYSQLPSNYWTKDRKPLEGLTGEALADELSWQALEDAAKLETAWYGPKVPKAPWETSDKITKQEQKALDARPLTFDLTTSRRCSEWELGKGGFLTKTREAQRREYIKSAEAGKVIERKEQAA